MYARRNIPELKPWLGAMDPFKIADGLYYVGTFQECSHLIDTGDGLVLIDSGDIYTLHMVIDSIYRLGFDPRNIKYAIFTHYHGDHCGSANALKNLTGCTTLLGELDVEPAFGECEFVPDIKVKDGDTLTLGNKTFRFLHTPGHTKGCISVFFETTLDGKRYCVGTFGGAGANTLRKKHPSYYPGILEDLFSTIDRLLQEKVDIFIGNHVWNNNTFEKAKILAETGENQFLDPTEWPKFLNFCKERALAVDPNE